MFKKYNWQQPIYKNDLITVIIFGLTAAILGGFLSGLIDSFLYKYGMNISFSLLINSLLIGFAVRRAYANYHVLYPTLSLGFYFIALFFTFVARNVGLIGIQNLGFILTQPESYYLFFTQPFIVFINVFKAFDFLYFVLAILNIVFIVLGFVSVYKLSKRLN